MARRARAVSRSPLRSAASTRVSLPVGKSTSPRQLFRRSRVVVAVITFSWGLRVVHPMARSGTAALGCLAGHAVAQGSRSEGGGRVVDRRAAGGAGHRWGLPRVAGGGFGAVAQLGEPGFEERQHRNPAAVLAFVVDEGAKTRFVEGTDAVPQVAQRRLVVVGQRKVVVGHAGLPSSVTAYPVPPRTNGCAREVRLRTRA